MAKNTGMHLTFVMLLLSPTLSFAQNNFSCSYGKQASCLDYGDKVCSSRSKCVEADASCFSNYQCDYEGFTCKSNVTSIANKYDDLVGDYNDIIRKNKQLVSDYNELLEHSRFVQSELNEAQSGLDDMQRCLRRAASLDDFEACRYQ